MRGPMGRFDTAKEKFPKLAFTQRVWKAEPMDRRSGLTAECQLFNPKHAQGRPARTFLRSQSSRLYSWQASTPKFGLRMGTQS